MKKVLQPIAFSSSVKPSQSSSSPLHTSAAELQQSSRHTISTSGTPLGSVLPVNIRSPSPGHGLHVPSPHLPQSIGQLNEFSPFVWSHLQSPQ
jgi:hypothetical protein